MPAKQRFRGVQYRGKAPAEARTAGNTQVHRVCEQDPNAEVLGPSWRITKCKHMGTRPPVGIGSLRDCGIVQRGKTAEVDESKTVAKRKRKEEGHT